MWGSMRRQVNSFWTGEAGSISIRLGMRTCTGDLISLILIDGFVGNTFICIAQVDGIIESLLIHF
jgi:hypothetical protein